MKKFVLAVALVLGAFGGYTSVASATDGPGVGYFEICKLADNSGGAVTGSFTFTWSGGSATVQVGTCSPLQQVPAGNLTITETSRSGFVVSAVTASPSGRLVSSNLAAGSATIQIVAGDPSTQTVVSFANKVVSPPTGFIEICKQGGDANVTGNFQFSVNGSQSLVTVPAAACSAPIEVPAGTATIQEQARTGFSLASVTMVPAGRLVSADLPNRKATVTVVAGDVSTQTVVTFTNVTQNGQLKICKAADPNSPTPVTGSFTFTLSPAPSGGSSTVTVPVGACSTPVSYPVGANVTVTEGAAAGYAVSSITIVGSGTIGTSSLASRTATVTIRAGTSDLTFTNKGQAPGQIKICKLADPTSPSAVTGSFTFTLSPAGTNAITNASTSSVTVPVGSCSQPISYPQGTSVVVTEATTGFTVTAITTVPSSGGSTITSSDLANRKATLTIGPGTTDVNFVNKGPTDTGQIQVCKAADPSSPSPVTGSFTFTLSPAAAGNVTSVTVGVGECSAPLTYPVGTTVTLTEAAGSYTVTAITIAGGGSTLGTFSLANAMAAVTIGAGTSKLTFQNKAPAPSVCNYTKGYYRNHADAVSSIIGAGGQLALPQALTVKVGGTTTTSSTLTTAQVVAILQATPAQLALGSGGALNLLQQALTALLNIERGSVASAAVQTAIAQALASLTVTFDANGNLIAVSSTASNVGALTDTLSGFNESNHCD